MNPRAPEIPPHKLITALRGFNLLPAIVFLPTRRKCDEAASETAADKSQKADAERQAKRRQIFDEYVIENPEISKHKHRKILLNSGVASHHAGHIPAWKLLIEKMMSAGLLNAIFATSTVAAGVDFPARTVVISNADTRGNDGWRPLAASELQQMTGRAGRRGKDNVGFAMLAPGQFQNPRRIADLLRTQPDPLESRFRATYTSLLNLLDAFGEFSHVRDIAEKSFAFRDTRRQIDKLERDFLERSNDLSNKLASGGLSVDDARGFERLTSAKTRLQEKLPQTRAEFRHNWLRENVVSGRIVTQGRSGKRLFLVLNVRGDKVTAMRDDGQGASFDIARVNRIYTEKYPVSDDAIEKAFFDVFEGRDPPLEEPKVRFKRSDADEAVELIDKLLSVPPAVAGGLTQPSEISVANSGVDGPPNVVDADLHPPATAGGTDTIALLWESLTDADALERIRRDIDFLKSETWLPFERRAKVLHHFGYLDFHSQKVTERGKWLADVRVDRPLLVGEALSRGMFEDLGHKFAAGLMAALAADPDRNYGDLYLSDKLLGVLTELEDVIYDVSNAEWKAGVEPAEEINFSAAAAAERWVEGMAWDDLVYRTKAEEGDLVRLLSRTGEALLQIANLRDSNPKAAETARATSDIILREPVR